MHNIVKWPNIQGFYSMFGNFTTLCLKGLNLPELLIIEKHIKIIF